MATNSSGIHNNHSSCFSTEEQLFFGCTLCYFSNTNYSSSNIEVCNATNGQYSLLSNNRPDQYSFPYTQFIDFESKYIDIEDYSALILPSIPANFIHFKAHNTINNSMIPKQLLKPLIK